MKRRFGEVLEDENKIKLFKRELHALQGSDFNLVKSDDKEGRVNEMDETFCRGLQPNIGSEGDTLKGQLSERNVNLDSFSSLFTFQSGSSR